LNKWRRVFVGIGSNLGERETLCRNAVKLLDEQHGFRVTAVSSWHETEPEGMVSEHMFINGVVEGLTSLSVYDLVKSCLDIETHSGRDRARQGMDRPLDMDLLYMEGVVTGYDAKLRPSTNKELITVPHPGISKRVFVLKPWSELAPDLHVPVFNKTVAEMLQALTRSGEKEDA
jgi:2-amino-4-hydroxy-6-hydroxymethyldihydropteridine diphosphokinase